jgi:holo-[acyl-carrier protein] synthase
MTMTIHLGVDIIEIGRIEIALERWGNRFIKRLYTETEIKICRGRSQKLSARFAGKEAVMKVLGTGRRGISWREIEILQDENHKPLVYLHGNAKLKAQELGIREIAISLSHSKEYAIALAIG